MNLKTKPAASKSAVRNVRKWLRNRNDPIHHNEVEFVDAKDVIAARPPRAPFRPAFEQNVLIPIVGRLGLFSNRPGRDPTQPSDCTTIEIDDDLFDGVVSLCIFLVAVVMLIAPLWALTSLENQFHKLGVITGFLIIFLLVLNWGTLAKPFEILAATAG